MMQENYLEAELKTLLKTDISAWNFLQGGSLDGVWYWDLLNLDNEWMSPEFWRTFGFDPATKRASPTEWQEIIFEDDLALSLENFAAHVADPDHPYDQIVRYRHADGSIVWIRCRGIAIRDADGKPTRMLGAHTDITPIKKSEMKARAGWRAAELANEELRSFAYSVSHDMKAPANTLGLLLNELKVQSEGKLDDDATELLAMCSTTVDRMKSLVEYVLDYTRIVTLATDKAEISLNQVVASAMKKLQPEITARNAEVSIGQLPNILAIPQQMEIFMQCLLSNAIKYCPIERIPEIQIFAEIKPERDLCSITVKDNGIGIAPINHDRIFTLFQRLHGHNEIQGSGIGLTMCKRIALNHEGQIDLVSSPGMGAAFTLCLPMRVLQGSE